LPHPAKKRVLELSVKMPEVTEMAAFGESFGRLVREKRGIEGLSQEELAERAEMAKARISDLENGKVNNPQARTVDALCVALNISREERACCYEHSGPTLPPLLLENLALRFGHGNPSALEGDLVAFLNEKALEFAAMQKRLAAMDSAGSLIAALVVKASAALEIGDFQGADAKLAEAEGAQLRLTTLPALDGLYRLRFERGNARLLAGDVVAAAAHWEAAANYFRFFDAQLEADRRYEGAGLLREHAYRYKNADALYEAATALRANLLLWTKVTRMADWCKAMNALGGVYWRLSQFDDPAKFSDHLTAAEAAYVEVRESTGPTIQPYFYAISGGNLANIYSDSAYSDGAEYVTKLELALDFLLSAASAIDQLALPVEWGIFQHNLGCTYIKLAGAQAEQSASVDLIDKAIAHLEFSFEVRDPVDMLQYWVASCRSLAEALITGSAFRDAARTHSDLQRAGIILHDAKSKISKAEHPNQWGNLTEQEDRLLDMKMRLRLDG
jgi:transcriptional regulator with XRE-family HTH domain